MAQKNKKSPLTQHGILPLPKDDRDIVAGGLLTLPEMKDLPKEFEIPISDEWIYNQGNTDTCAGHASALEMDTEENVRLDPLFTWILARYLADMKPEDYGVDVRSMLMAWVKFGGIEFSRAPYNVNDDPKWRDIKNWDMGLLQKSVYHKQSSAVFVRESQGYDMFDTLRATVYRFKTPCIIGMLWPYNIGETQDKLLPDGYGHALCAVGWKVINGVTYLRVINSWGIGVGDKGRFNLSREIINKNVPEFGAGFCHDETPENLRHYIDNGIKLDDGKWIQFWTPFWSLIMVLLKKGLDTTKSIMLVNEPLIPPKIAKLAHLINFYEGSMPWNRAMRNNNPGNCRYHTGGYLSKYGTVTQDKDGFARFETLELGWLYLENMLMNWAKTSRKDWTILQLMTSYSPVADANDPVKYAKFLTDRLGIEPNATLKELLT